MSYYDGFTPVYTFRLQIEREDRMILDTSITAKGSREEIIKVKKNIRKLLDEYAPLPPVLLPAPDIPPLPEPEPVSEPENPEASPDQQHDDPPEEAPAPQRGGVPRIANRTESGEPSVCAVESAETPSAFS